MKTLSMICSLWYCLSKSPILPVARVFDNTSDYCLGAEVSPKMRRTRSKALSEANDPVTRDESGSGEPTMVKVLS